MSQPNVILIFTDNQQAATLGCYGNHEVQTPHIDQMAADGMLFEHAYCANAFCSACRASALTGMLPSQHGVHSWIDDRNMAEWPAGWHALNGLATLPETLQGLGYRTGLFGKYHLGDPQTKGPGWDSWVTMADGHVRSFYDNAIFDNGDSYAQPGHAVDFFTDKALDWIGQQTEPYFAYLPYPAPYGHWPATNDGRRNRFAALYDDCPMETVPRQGLSAAAVRSYDRVKSGSGHGLDFSMLMRAPNHLPSLRNYYSQISMLDDAVGRIVAADPNALIIFTTDHGLSLGHHGFWGHGASTYPSNLHLAAHSIPMILRHPGAIAAGERTPILVSNVDIYATILDYVGGQADPGLPSRSFAGLLRGEAVADWGADEVFSEQEETRVIRTPQWAFFKRYAADNAPEFGDELFNVAVDPSETENLAQDPGHAHIVAELSARIEAFFALHARGEADLWRGGQPIQNSMLQPYWREFGARIGRRSMVMGTIDFAMIPAGAFTMGAADGPHAEDGEGPARMVKLDAYWIAKTAVSTAQFALFVDATGHVSTAEAAGGSAVFQGQLADATAHPTVSALAPWWRWVKGASWRRPDGQNDAAGGSPVVHVSRTDALAFCRWAGRRLPTEAEWERAAGSQAGITPHIWSGRFPDAPDAPPAPRAVDAAEANAFGLKHACGNVWEWTSDRFTRLHAPRLTKNPTGPLNGAQGVVKGGSFLCAPRYCARFRPSSRRAENPGATTSHLGFRVAQDEPG